MMPGEIAAKVILVIMGDEGFGDVIAIVLRDAHNRRNIPCSIDNERFPAGWITNQISEVLHWTNFDLFEVQCWFGHSFVLITLHASRTTGNALRITYCVLRVSCDRVHVNRVPTDTPIRRGSC